jgi:hypothetical protein
MEVTLNMSDIQMLITCVNESKLDPTNKEYLRDLLDVMQNALMHQSYLRVIIGG